MAKRIAISNLNASTLDILNTIRANASAEYQSLVPVVESETDIPKVGEVICGYPAMANQFLSALINRIASVRVKSATFNNAYAELKKGYLEFGETVEEVFVGICKAREFSVEKAESREFKRSVPDVRSAFHIMNWRVQYPITIQEQDLQRAFMSMTGVQDMIARIVDAVYTSAEYDEFLLFKYLIIKAVSHGKMYPVSIGDGTDLKDAATQFRGISNLLGFMSNKYNASGVTTTTPRSDQYIFMDSMFNSAFDVEVLASAFNMDKADFMGRLMLIDDFTTFDNDRFSVITAGSDQIDSITDAELAIMADVKGVLVDREWFQVYDNLSQMSEKYVASGLYWNYFYNVWKTVSSSPFSNAVVFVTSNANTNAPATLTATVTDKTVTPEGTTILALSVGDSNRVNGGNVTFVQTASAVQNGIAVQKYGAYIIPSNANAIKCGVMCAGKYYESENAVLADTLDVDDTITLLVSGYIDNTLSALSANDGSAVTLTPSFNANTLTYTATATSTSFTVTATPTDNDATVVIKLGSTTVESGQALTLSEGDNKIDIIVTGTEPKTYTITANYTA